MAKTFHVDIVSAEQSVYSGEATMVIAPGASGELGILPEHVPLLTRIKPGVVRIRTGDFPALPPPEPLLVKVGQ